MHRAVQLAFALILASGTVSAADVRKPAAKSSGDGTFILTDREDGTTIGKLDGETILLQKTPDGTYGKMGKDKVILHKDGQGNTIGKIGDKKVFCHRDPESGLSFCK